MEAIVNFIKLFHRLPCFTLLTKHSHTIIPFKWVEGKLVAGYCIKCGCIKTGNPECSYYQDTKCVAEAIKFIDYNIAYVKSRYEGRENFKKMLDSGIEFKGGWNAMIEWDEAVVNKYETVEEYERIKMRLRSNSL